MRSHNMCEMNGGMKDVPRLRELARKWREFAEVSSATARKDRLAWADYLERLADRIERALEAESEAKQS
jgi:hypothetical protein